MISSLKITNFKTLKDVDLAFRSLNLLTGLNGTGKSSVLHTLLMLRQSILDTSLVKGYLKLNGSLIEIGTGKDALYYYASNENITISTEFEDSLLFTWNTYTNPDADYLEPMDKGNMNLENDYAKLKEKSLFNDNFQYLNAEHIAPQEIYKTSQFEISKKQIGNRGEYTTHFLNTYGARYTVLEHLRHPNARSEKLNHQVEAWLNEISPNIRVRTQEIPGSDDLLLRYQYEIVNDTTGFFKPSNVGFGITYVLPIIVSILSAEPGKLIILENPESHLHPKGQSRIGKLIALAAQIGIQIIIETHSDHILNGIRVAVKNKELNHDKVGIFFFDRLIESREHQARVVTPELGESGKLSFWPEGFFDEWENMLDELIL